jgi:hypothetical protein
MGKLEVIMKAENYINNHKGRDSVIALSNLMEAELKKVALNALGAGYFKKKHIENYNFRFILHLLLEKNLIKDSNSLGQVNLNQMIRLKNKADQKVYDIHEEEANDFLKNLMFFFEINDFKS